MTHLKLIQLNIIRDAGMKNKTPGEIYDNRVSNTSSELVPQQRLSY